MASTSKTIDLNTLISEDRLQDALTYLVKEASKSPISPKLKDTLTHLQGQLSYLENQIHLDVIADDEARIERNSIRKGILDIIPKFSSSSRKNENRKRVLRILLYIGLAVPLFIIGFSKKDNIQIKADLIVDQIEFNKVMGTFDIQKQVFDSITIAFFKSAMLESDSIFSQKYNDTASRVNATEIVLSPFSDNAESSLPIHSSNRSLYISDLNLENRVHLQLSLPDHVGQPNLFRVYFKSDKMINGRLSSHNQVFAEVQNMDLLISGKEEEIFNPTIFCLKSTKDKGNSLAFQSMPGSLMLDLFSIDSINLAQGGITVTDPSFFRTSSSLSNKSQVSTILKGSSITVQEKNQDIYKRYELKPETELSLKSDEVFTFSKIEIVPAGIRLSFSGTVDELLIGPERTSYNPLVFQWILFNHWIWLVGIGMFLLGFILILPQWLQNKIFSSLKTIRDLVFP